MAKKPRMGRNLGALLGGATRERTASQSADEATVETGAESPTSASPVVSKASVTSVAANEAANDAIDGGEPARPSSTSGASTATSRSVKAVPAEPVADDTATGDRLRTLGVDQIRRGSYQPRRLFDQTQLQELADSIRAQGLIQPVLVRPDADGAFELIAGERRWRAAQLAGITEIPALVRDLEDQSVAAVSLIENIQRADLNPLEEASALSRLCEEFSMTHAAVAEAVGRSRASVSNLMRLLDLHDEVKLMVDRGELDMGHARALLGAARADQPQLARRVVKHNLTVRATEQLVRESLDLDAGKQTSSNREPVRDPDIDALEQRLGELLGAPVSVKHSRNGRGKLEIRYTSVAELDGILKHIR